jgi:hypothetical protein
MPSDDRRALESLYPEIDFASDLAATVDRRASSLGLALDGFSNSFGGVKITTARGFATILLGAEKRAFLVGIYAPGLEWAAGSTVDLDAALAAVASWHGGANIERFVADYPFMVPGELAVAYERGTIAEVQWGNLLSSEYPSSCLSLLAQLHGYEVLRKFFPEISYGEIRFTMPPPQRETSVIFVRDDSPGYSLREVGAESREYRASELDEVVNHIVEHLSLD